MRRLSFGDVGIDQGEAMIFTDYESDGPMWTGNGRREVRFPVRFSEPFLSPPSVRVGLTLWDFSVSANTRADLSADEVTETGFTIVFRTWADTRIARVRVDWQAIGPLQDEEAWEID